MKRWATVVAILVPSVWPSLPSSPPFREPQRSGPGIPGNLKCIQLAKDQWLADGHNNEWPTANDLFPATSPGKAFRDVILPRCDEFYFINRTGAPPFDYIPKAGGQFKGGEILVLSCSSLALGHRQNFHLQGFCRLNRKICEFECLPHQPKTFIVCSIEFFSRVKQPGAIKTNQTYACIQHEAENPPRGR
jgi:hypothetical protein